MANILKGYEHISSEELAQQIALLQTTNLWNTISPKVWKAYEKTIRFINKMRAKAGKPANLREPIVKEFSDLLEEKFQSLRKLNKAELEMLLRSEIAKRVGVREPISDPFLSVMAIDEAAAGLEIDSELTPAQKAMAVSLRYQERIWKQLQEQANKLTQEQKTMIEANLDKAILELPAPERKKLEAYLKVDQLTGEALQKAMLGSSGPIALISLINLSGFGAYLMLTTVIHAVFTTMLGVTVPWAVYQGATTALAFLTGPIGWFLSAGVGSIQIRRGQKKINRDLLAHTVWFGVSNCGQALVPDDRWLPSANASQTVIQQDEELKKLTVQRDQAVKIAYENGKKLKEVTDKLLKIDEDKRKAEHSHGQARTQLAQLEQELVNQQSKIREKEAQAARLKGQIAAYRVKAESVPVELEQRLQRSELELASYRNQTQEKEREIKEYEELAESVLRDNEEYKKLITVLEKELTERKQLSLRAEAELKKAQEKENEKVESRRKQLEDIWQIHYQKIHFESRATRWVAKLEYDQWLAVERALFELNASEDPNSLSRSKMKTLKGDLPHLGFKIPRMGPGRIFYQVCGDIIRVIDISKKQDFDDRVRGMKMSL